MKKENVQVNQQELLALKETAKAIVKTVNSILDDYELATDEAVSLNEAERATLFGNVDSPFANAESPSAKSYTINRSIVYRHPTLESHWVICRGSILPSKVSDSCSPAAASFLKRVFSDSSLVNAGLVLQPLTVYATSKSFLANVCVGSSVSGSLYIPD